MKNLKALYFIFPLLIFSSCKDDISDGKYRNESYVFYQEEGKVGEWQLIDPLLKITPPKSNSTYFFPNGNKYAELTVIDSFPNRIIKFYDKETDKLTRTTFYKLDTLQKEIYVEGYYRQYHSSLGALQSEGIIKDGMTQGEWKYYADDGVTIEQISQNKDGLLHGPIKEYYENGVLKNSQKYWNDRIIDTNRVYNEDGTIKMIQIHHLDTITFKKNFVQFNYNANGKLEATAFFENNKSNLKIYYENGNLKEVSTKVNNKHHGLVTIFHENGIKMMEGTASNGILVGDFKFYNQSGKLIKTVYYELGNPIKTITH